MRLRSIGLPEEVCRWGTQLRDRAAGLAGGDGPGGETAYFAEVWRKWDGRWRMGEVF